MRILTKAKLRFDDPNGQEPSVIVNPRDLFAEVPEWVRESTMFKLANLDGTAEIIESRAQEREAEKNAPSQPVVKPPSDKAKAAEGTDTKAGK